MGFLSMPFRGLVRVFEEIADRAEREIYDDEGVKAELMALYASLESGTISEEDFTKREAELVEKLEQIEEYKKGKVNHAA